MIIRQLVLAAMAVLIVSLPASGQKSYRLKNIEFRGNEVLSDDLLSEQINTRSKTNIEKLFFWKKNPVFIESVFKEDINRMISTYNRNGFLKPEITYNIDTAGIRRLIRVKITINENSFVTTGKVVLVVPGDTSVSNLADSLSPVLPLKPKIRFVDEDVFGSETILKKSLADHGYPLAAIEHHIGLSEDTTQASVTFIIDPGIKSYFGDITIKGASLVPEKFIRKYFLFSTGELYNQEKINRTQQELFETDLFQYVVIASRKDSTSGNKIPVSVNLSELPRWRIETGLGYGTEDKLRLSARLTRLNFLGGTRRLIIDAKTSYFLPFSFDLRFVQPDILIPRLDLIINPFWIREREISYSIDRLGGGINFLYKLSRKLTANFSYAFEYDRIPGMPGLQLDPAELKNNKSVFSIGSQVNSTDDPFYPSKGYRLNASLSLAGLGYSNNVNYYKIALSLVNYLRLSDQVILASRLGSGVLKSLEQNRRTPLSERFYLGGASSLRGWGRHRITPVNENGVAVGGNTMVEASLELRYPIYDIFGGVLFIDAGNVWEKEYSYDPELLHYDAGIGFRVKTPIGPIRLDFATPVIKDHFSFQFFISIGHAF